VDEEQSRRIEAGYQSTPGPDPAGAPPPIQIDANPILSLRELWIEKLLPVQKRARG